MRDELICLFERPAAAYAARRELRALQKELRLGRIALIAIVTRPALDNVQFEQDGDVGPWAGARFGLVAGALLGALLLAPFAGLRMAVAAREGLAAAPSAADWVTALALVVALVSGLTALLAALGGALLGAVVATLLNFGLPARLLSVIGEGLAFGQVALVTQVNERQRRPLADALALAGGTLLQLSGSQDAPSSATQDLAARFAAWAYGGAGSTQMRHLAVVALETPPVDPRQRDLVVAECTDAAHARQAARSLRRLRGSLGGLVAGNRAIVTRNEAGRVRIQQAENVTAGRGGLFGLITMVGHCFGGMVATMFHQAHPQLSRGYVLLDTAAHAPAAPRWVATRAPWLIGMAGRLLELLPAERRALLHNDMQPFKGTGDIQLNRLMADASHTTLRAWLMVYRGIAQYDGVAALRSMTQPVWVIVGEEDTVFTVEDAQTIQRHVPGAQLITVPGANHIIVVNNPEVVERLILDFIRDTQVFTQTVTAPA